MLMRRDNHRKMCVMFDSSYYIPCMALFGCPKSMQENNREEKWKKRKFGGK